MISFGCVWSGESGVSEGGIEMVRRMSKIMHVWQRRRFVRGLGGKNDVAMHLATEH